MHWRQFDIAMPFFAARWETEVVPSAAKASAKAALAKLSHGSAVSKVQLL